MSIILPNLNHSFICPVSVLHFGFSTRSIAWYCVQTGKTLLEVIMNKRQLIIRFLRDVVKIMNGKREV